MKKIKPLLLFVCMMMEVGTTIAQVLEQDSLALVAFYNSTGGPNWNNNNHWLTGPVSTWYGVTVEGDRVIKLIIYSNNLQGEIPSEICNLTGLTDFNLGHEDGLIGEIPKEIYQLSHLQGLFIGYCALTGTLPNEIGYCENLQLIQLMDNNLFGSIPLELGNLNSLLTLDLHNNQLTGPIPPELGNCSNLIELIVCNNNLSGLLPQELASINSLNSIDVSNNDLSGPVPDEFAYQISYWFFYINDNNFDYLPPFNNWYLLSGLKVENNKLTFEHLESHAQAGYMWFDYAPQDSMGVKIDTALVPGSSFNIYSGTEGEFTEYFWYRNNELILQSMEADTLFLEEISNADTGKYWCRAENSLATELTLARRPVHITIDTSGVNIDHLSENSKIKLYPNPATEFVIIDLPDKSKIIDLKIFDMNGKSILHCKGVCLNDHKTMINVAGINPGIYILQVQTENSNYATKLIINNRGERQ